MPTLAPVNTEKIKLITKYCDFKLFILELSNNLRWFGAIDKLIYEYQTCELKF